MTVDQVAVVGLGKLGLCQAATLANSGLTVFGIDIDERRVADVNQSIAPFPEPKLQSYLERLDDNLVATTDYAEAIQEADATIVFVDTPLSNGRHSTKYIEAVCETLGEQLADLDNHHTVILRSTVMPRTTRNDVQRWLEDASGKTVGKELGLAYVPEFTAVGNVIPGMERPDFFLVGEVNERAGAVATSLCHTMRENTAPVLRMRAESAELAKMANNSFRTMKISFANALAQIADDVDANVDKVVKHFQEDSHINAKYMTPGVRYGGPCYSRDNVTFEKMASNTPAGTVLPAATDEVNQKHSEWIADVIRQGAREDQNALLVMGLSYKPGTAIVVGSQGLDLARELADDIDLLCHDPQALSRAREKLGESVEFVPDLDTALDRADIATIATLWDEYTELEIYDDRDLTIVDPWRAFDAEDLEDGIEYVPLGKRALASDDQHVVLK